MAYTKAEACRKLGIEKSKLSSVPQITELLSRIMLDLKKRSLPSDPYYYLYASADPDARKIAMLSKSKQIREALPLEAFCLAASIDSSKILEVIINSIARLNALTATALLSASQGEVVETTIQAAKDIDNGHKDRRLHMQVSGLMPMPKGAKTIVNVQTSATSSSSPVQQAIVLPAPSPEQTVRRLSERLHAVRPALPESNKVEDAILVDEQ